MNLLNKSHIDRDWRGSLNKLSNKLQRPLNSLVLSPVEFIFLKTSRPIEANPIFSNHPIPVVVVVMPRIRDYNRRAWSNYPI